jgi:hypothetical protein
LSRRNNSSRATTDNHYIIYFRHSDYYTRALFPWSSRFVDFEFTAKV